jgi:hypothetical protein
MSTQPCNPHPIASDGTSWRQRAVAALDPVANPIDGRNISDLIGYAERYASVLQYWNDSDSRAGDWRDFVDQDVSALVARIGREDIPALRDRFAMLRDAVASAGGAQLPAHFGELYAEFMAIAQRLDDWYRAAPEGLSLNSELEGWIASDLGEVLRTVVAQALRAHNVNPLVPALQTDSLHPLWELDAILPDSAMFPNGQLNHNDDQATALAQLARAHGQMLEVLQQLVFRTPGLLGETLYAYPQHQPHMALLVAFLLLFGRAQAHLNQLTAKHLKFYYRRVLGIEPSSPVADRVHLVLEPAKSLDGDPRIAEDTEFKAGKDASGVELIYASDEELVLNQARLDEDGLKSVFVSLQDGEVKNIHAATDADSTDGLGADLLDADGQWQTFGGEDMPYAELGFAVASPMFNLAEGDRFIVLRFDLNEPLSLPEDVSEDDVAKELRHNIKAQGSGEKGWVDLQIHEIRFEDDGQPCLKLRLYLGAMEPALVAYDSTVLDGGFSTRHPLLRLILDNEGQPAFDISGDVRIDMPDETPCEPVVKPEVMLMMAETRMFVGAALPQKIVTYEDSLSYFAAGTVVRYKGKLYRAVQAIEQAGFRPEYFDDLWMEQPVSYPYRYLQGLEVRGLSIELDVRGVRNVLLENDLGILDPAKPFLPFGPVPKSGSTFLVGSPEVFSKQLDEVRLQVSWADLPEENFHSHYNFYTTRPSDNQYFKATTAFLKDGAWTESGTHALFDDKPTLGYPPADTRCFRFAAANDVDPLLTRDTRSGDFTQFRAGMRQGFMRLRLNQGFGHGEYPKLLASAALPGGNIPNAPHVPLIAELTLSYKAHETIEFHKKGVNDYVDRVEQLFQVWPFGRREIWPVADADKPGEVPVERRLLPHFEVSDPDGNSRTAEGSLYIGLNGLDLSAGSQNLALLIQVAEGSADPELPVQPVVWSYLVGDVWHDFSDTDILADGTNGLLRSGIIRFALPKRMTANNQILPENCHWLRVSVARNTNAVCRFIALHTQAVTASLRDQGNDPSHLATPLPAGSISKLKARMAAVKKVSQPYASFGGRQQESDDAFNVRVSERLRHKGRAVTLFDYERLVLQGFPEIYKVKCINHTNRQQEFVPGAVRLIVVPDLRNRNAVNPLEPKASLDTLDSIHDYLAARASDFVELEVTNPDYEAIRIECQVRFHTGYDQGYYLSQLVSDIQNFLSPWLHDEAADISFGGRIHRSQVLLFVEQREYVDFVTDFRIDQQVAEDTWLLDVAEAVASRASSVLVSAPAEEYGIGVAVESCEDEVKTPLEVEGEEPRVLSGPRFLGNTRSRELHDLNNLTDMCHLEKIAADRQRRFYSIADARAMGYDLCGHCFGRDKSLR